MPYIRFFAGAFFLLSAPLLAAGEDIENRINPSPVSKSMAVLSPERRAFLKEGFDKHGKRKPIPDQEVKKILESNPLPYPQILYTDPRGSLTEKVYFNGSLFDREQRFLTEVKAKDEKKEKTFQWFSNTERMQRGFAPICYRAHQDKKKDPIFNTSEYFKQIMRDQTRWTIQLHHRDRKAKSGGLITLVPGLHLGNEAAYYVDFSGFVAKILANRIPKSEASNYKNKGNKKIIKNVLHPIFGSDQKSMTKEERETYDEWRVDFWKAVGNGEIFAEFPSLTETSNQKPRLGQKRKAEDDDDIVEKEPTRKQPRRSSRNKENICHYFPVTPCKIDFKKEINALI